MAKADGIADARELGRQRGEEASARIRADYDAAETNRLSLMTDPDGRARFAHLLSPAISPARRPRLRLVKG